MTLTWKFDFFAVQSVRGGSGNNYNFNRADMLENSLVIKMDRQTGWPKRTAHTLNIYYFVVIEQCIHSIILAIATSQTCGRHVLHTYISLTI